MLPQHASNERCSDRSLDAAAALQIAEKMIEAQETEKQINIAREAYRGVAARGAMLFFLLQASGLCVRGGCGLPDPCCSLPVAPHRPTPAVTVQDSCKLLVQPERIPGEPVFCCCELYVDHHHQHGGLDMCSTAYALHTGAVLSCKPNPTPNAPLPSLRMCFRAASMLLPVAAVSLQPPVAVRSSSVA